MPKSMANAIIKIFEIVPSPGFSLSGIHKARTIALINKVEAPILKPVLIEIP